MKGGFKVTRDYLEIDKSAAGQQSEGISIVREIPELSRIYNGLEFTAEKRTVASAHESRGSSMVASGILPDTKLVAQGNQPGTDALPTEKEQNKAGHKVDEPQDRVTLGKTGNQEIGGLIHKLADGSFPVRQAASEALAKIGVVALPQLKDALDSKDPEVRKRVHDLVDLRASPFLEIANARNWDKGCGSPDIQQFSQLLTSISKLSPNPEARTRELDALCDVIKSNKYSANDETKKSMLSDFEKIRTELANPAQLLNAASKTSDLAVSPSTAAAARDRDLAKLKLFPNLESIKLNGAPITDAGLEHLKHSAKLTSVELRETNITDGGLAVLRSLRSLEELDLADTAITDAGLAGLNGKPGLRKLTLDGTRVTDEGLSHLKNLPDLECISLKETAVTERELDTLKAMKNLNRIELDSARIGDAAIHKLRLALPNCLINGERHRKSHDH